MHMHIFLVSNESATPSKPFEFQFQLKERKPRKKSSRAPLDEANDEITMTLSIDSFIEMKPVHTQFPRQFLQLVTMRKKLMFHFTFLSVTF